VGSLLGFMLSLTVSKNGSQTKRVQQSSSSFVIIVCIEMCGAAVFSGFVKEALVDVTFVSSSYFVTVPPMS